MTEPREPAVPAAAEAARLLRAASEARPAGDPVLLTAGEPSAPSPLSSFFSPLAAAAASLLASARQKHATLSGLQCSEEQCVSRDLGWRG